MKINENIHIKISINTKIYNLKLKFRQKSLVCFVSQIKFPALWHYFYTKICINKKVRFEKIENCRFCHTLDNLLIQGTYSFKGSYCNIGSKPTIGIADLVKYWYPTSESGSSSLLRSKCVSVGKTVTPIAVAQNI